MKFKVRLSFILNPSTLKAQSVDFTIESLKLINY